MTMARKRQKSTYDSWLQKVVAANDETELLSLYAQEWATGGSPPIQWAELERMLRSENQGRVTRYSGNESQLADLIHRFEHARKAVGMLLPELQRLWEMGELHFPIICAIYGSRDMVTLWKKLLDGCNVENRCYLAGELVNECTRIYGKEHTRGEIARLWKEQELLEEERESFLSKAVKEHLYEWQTLPTLGQDAQIIVSKLLAREEVRPEDLGQFFLNAPPLVQGSRPYPDWVKEKVQSLGQRVTVPLRLGGCGLNKDELARLELGALTHPFLALAAFHKYRRFFHHPILEELWHMWRHERPSPLFLSFSGTSVHANLQVLSVPLIRLMHMRRLLDTPSLASSLAHPEMALVPEAIMDMFWREDVAYAPEIHLAGGAERGWRRRWAESTGEGLSCLFMEDALALDLSTLSRIPESTETTPDFMANTFAGEHIVFESKGATSWDTFRKSKRKALKQLAKTGPPMAWQRTLRWTQDSKGRSFACCLFAASDGEVEPSQFHVEDPPFAFDRYFHEGWENVARRYHYAAVLQAAGLHEEAARLLRRPASESSPGEVATFRLSLTEEVTKEFAGTYWRPWELARAIGHPQVDALRNLRVFAGIESDLRALLQRGTLPPARPFGPPQKETMKTSDVPPFGLLPGLNSESSARGFFSRMSNGSFLAIELE